MYVVMLDLARLDLSLFVFLACLSCLLLIVLAAQISAHASVFTSILPAAISSSTNACAVCTTGACTPRTGACIEIWGACRPHRSSVCHWAHYVRACRRSTLDAPVKLHQKIASETNGAAKVMTVELTCIQKAP